MAGTIVADTLQSSITGTPVQFNDGVGTQIGTLCRAWVNFNGTGTVAIRGSFNVTSITDNGTGDYTVNFTTAMADANFSAIGVCTLNDTIVAGNTQRGFSPRSYATTSVRFVVTDGGSGVDPLFCNVGIFR